MLVQVGTKQVEPSGEIENVLFTLEPATGFGFHQYKVEFVKPPL